MIRILLFEVLPIILPSALYFLWLVRARRLATRAGSTPPAFGDAPWVWLAMMGVALAALLLVAITVLDASQDRDGVLVPAQVRPDGTVVPSHMEPRR